MNNVAISGATGFVGRALARRLVEEGRHGVTLAVRKELGEWRGSVRAVKIGDIHGETDWSQVVSGQEVVIHCAGRAHVMRDRAVDPLTEFRRVNRDGTLAFAEQAAKAGVKRFVFLSTIGVNGAESHGRPFRADDPVEPHSPYALSKYEAEEGLGRISAETGMEVVIIRPPLVYGANAPGNFNSLLKWVASGVPLPLGAIANCRSYVALDNLVDFVVRCIEHPRAAGRVFLVSDGEDLSTTELLRRTALAMGTEARLVAVPASLLWGAARLVGKPELAQRLCGSLQVDVSEASRVLDWHPLISVDEGLKRATKGYSS